MRKITALLFGIAAAINVFAVDYTAKAKVTLQSGSGYTCDLMLSESASYGALTGSVMNMEDRVIALYVLDGTTKLQIARTSDFSGVKVGLITDASTNYHISVSEVEGSKTLYLYDMDAGASYALTAGAEYDFTAAANKTIEDRFALNLSVPTGNLETCFTGSELQITNNPIFGNIVVTRVSNSAQMAKKPFGTTSIDMSSYPNNEDYLVEFGSGAKKRAFIVHVKY